MDHLYDAFIEHTVNQYLQTFLRDIYIRAQYGAPESIDAYCVSVHEGKKKEEIAQCMARVKNKGWGRQCSRNAQEGSTFCGSHAKQYQNGEYAWQKFGRIDEPAPECFINWYAKNNLYINDPNMFFASNSPENLSVNEMQELGKALENCTL